MKIALIGPESTAKTTLSQHLANYYNGICIPEYARDYVENLNRPYNYTDIEIIAQKQKEQLETSYNENYIFYDTDLIITKIWFDEVFHKCPNWIIDTISLNYIDLYLLCKPDIPWEADKVRENGGEKREYLYNLYLNELDRNNFKYQVIEGIGEVRTKNAINTINRFFE